MLETHRERDQTRTPGSGDPAAEIVRKHEFIGAFFDMAIACPVEQAEKYERVPPYWGHARRFRLQDSRGGQH